MRKQIKVSFVSLLAISAMPVLGYAQDSALLCQASISGKSATQEFLAEPGQSATIVADGKFFTVDGKNNQSVLIGIGAVVPVGQIRYINSGNVMHPINGTYGYQEASTEDVQNQAARITASLKCVDLSLAQSATLKPESVAGDFAKEVGNDNQAVLLQPTGFSWGSAAGLAQ